LGRRHLLPSSHLLKTRRPVSRRYRKRLKLMPAPWIFSLCLAIQWPSNSARKNAIVLLIASAQTG
jgi:hypothetical protein